MLQNLWRRIFGEKVRGKVVSAWIDIRDISDYFRGYFGRYIIEGEDGRNYYVRLYRPPIVSSLLRPTIKMVIRRRDDIGQLLEDRTLKYVEREGGYEVLEYEFE